MREVSVHKHGLDWESERRLESAFGVLGLGPSAASAAELGAARSLVREMLGEGGALEHDPLGHLPWPTAAGVGSAREQLEGFLMCGDWHGNLNWARAQLVSARENGLNNLVQLGDFGLWPGPDGRGFLDGLNASCRKHGVSVVWLDGNHEDFAQLARYPVLESGKAAGLRPVRSRVWHLPRGTRWRWGGLELTVAGGATSVDRASRTEGRDWWPGEELTEIESSRIGAAGPTDVLLLHDAPRSEIIPRRGGFRWGVREYERALNHQARVAQLAQALNPGAVFHGHFHVSYQVRQAAWEGGAPIHIQGLGGDSWVRESGLASGASVIIKMEELARIVGESRSHTAE